MQSVNCEDNLILAWSSTCVITNSTDAARFAMTNTKLHVTVVSISTQDNAKLLHQLKPGFKRKINWNRLFALSLENENGRTSYSEFYLPKLETKDDNIQIDGKNVFNHLVNDDIKTYENIRKIAIGQGDDYATRCLLTYPFFKKKKKK